MQPPRSHLYMQDYLRSIVIHSIDNFNYKNAEFAAERLLALDPLDSELLYLYCLALYHLGKYKTCYNRLVDCNISHLGCSFLFAKCCLQLDKHKEGVYHLTKLHYIYEDGTTSMEGASGHKGDFRLKHTYEHNRSIYPDSSVVYHVLGDLYQGMNDVKNASLSYGECLKFNQFDFEALQKLCKLGVDIRVKAIYKANGKLNGIVPGAKTPGTSYTPGNGIINTSSNNNNNESGIFGDSAAADASNKERVFGGLNIAIDDSFRDNSQSNIWNPFTNSPTKGTTSPRMTPSLRDSGFRNQQKRLNPVITPRMRSTSTGELPSAPLRKPVHNLSATFEFPKPSFPMATDSARNKQKDRNINITSRLISQPTATSKPDGHLNATSNSKSTPAHISSTRNSGSITPLINTPAPIGGFAGTDPTRTLKRTNSSTLLSGKEATALPGATQLSIGLFTSKEIEQAGVQLINLYSTFAKGFKAMCKFDCYKAIRIFDSLPEREKNTPWLLSKLGRLHYEIVNYKQSEYYFVQLRQVDRTRLEDMEYFSTLLWHLQKKVELTYLANELHDIDSNSSITWCVIGNLYSLMREHDEAIKCFTKATKLDPKFVYAYTLRGHEYFGNDNYEMALENFRISLLYDTRHYNALYGIGMVYINLGEYTKADYHFRKAVAINPINVILICCVGMVFEKLGKKSLALKQYELATKLQPLNPLPIFKKAQLLFSMQQFSQALRYLEELAQIAPDEALVHFLLGQLYNIQNNRFMALKEFTIALNLDPKGNYLIREAMESMRNKA